MVALLFFVDLPLSGEDGYPVLNRVDEEANKRQEEEEDNNDEGDSNISFNHFATGLIRFWMTEGYARGLNI